MYDLIDAFISHDWISTATGEQGYILAISCIVMVVLIVKLIDIVEGIFKAFTR